MLALKQVLKDYLNFDKIVAGVFFGLWEFKYLTEIQHNMLDSILKSILDVVIIIAFLIALQFYYNAILVYRKKNKDHYVMIGGSRDLLLTEGSINLLQKYMRKGYTFLVGDCPEGIDLDVQCYLALKGYKEVIIYYSEDFASYNSTKPRYIANEYWKTVGVPSLNKKDERIFYATKDIAMIKECNEAVFIWNGLSRATKSNIDFAYSFEDKKVTIFLKEDE